MSELKSRSATFYLLLPDSALGWMTIVDFDQLWFDKKGDNKKDDQCQKRAFVCGNEDNEKRGIDCGYGEELSAFVADAVVPESEIDHEPIEGAPKEPGGIDKPENDSDTPQDIFSCHLFLPFYGSLDLNVR
jgi:hypothetical protein